jgi:hypothetical protein
VPGAAYLEGDPSRDHVVNKVGRQAPPQGSYHVIEISVQLDELCDVLNVWCSVMCPCEKLLCVRVRVRVRMCVCAGVCTV